MKVDLFDYELPPELIAQTPIEPRDYSRLLIIDRKAKIQTDAYFYNVIDYLEKGDVLVLNHTRVLPARLYGKKETGAVIEFLLLKQISLDVWEVLVKPGKKVKVGDRVYFGESSELRATCIEITDEGSRLVQFYYDGIFEEVLDKLGEMPLPPYIQEKLDEKSRYQTVYYKEGASAAAPTAGLHFTPELLKKIEEKGIIITSLLLNVGLGTFRPVKADTIDEHKMHSEYYEVTEETAEILTTAKEENRRIIAVGTTSVRVLETMYNKYGKATCCSGWTDIFIFPGYTFKCVDGLITNFHLPKSTLLMLISAFMGRKEALEAYEYAVNHKYRFFSFGDAMFIK